MLYNHSHMTSDENNYILKNIISATLDIYFTGTMISFIVFILLIISFGVVMVFEVVRYFFCNVL